MTITISPMGNDDAQVVSDLFVSTIQSLDYYNERARKEEIAKYTPENLLASIQEDTDSILVARCGSEVIGFCISRYDDGVIWLSWFGVSQSYRHTGIGSKLLAALDETVPRRRAHKIWCDTRTSNLTSQGVLHKAGYSKITLLKNHWYNQDFFLWEKYPEK